MSTAPTAVGAPPATCTGLFDGTVALVTGAAQGIGLACARRLLAAGCRVALADIQIDAVRAAVAAIGDGDARCRAFQLDVREVDQCEQVVAEIGRAWGRIGVLVNNAGVSGRPGTVGVAGHAEELDRVLSVNVKGLLNLTLACADDLKATRGAVVNVASITSFVATKAHLAYGTSKGAVAQMTKFLARDFGPSGVRVNAVAPGLVMTPLTRHIADDPQRLGGMVERTSLKRPAEPDDIADPVVFLASGMARYVTGTILPVDGGYLAN